MTDNFSINQSSLAVSKKFNTSTNYNLLNSVPRALILKTKSDGHVLKTRAVKFNLEFWSSMRKSDFTSNRQLGIKLIEQLFEKHQEDI